jgi:DNA-binding NtrC family response regulator
MAALRGVLPVDINDMRSGKPIVLVLEDDANAADALSLILADWGAEVFHGVSLASLSERAGARLGEAHFIITDFDLGPGPDGVSLTPTLVAAAPGARVLVLSGSFNGRAQDAALRAGYDSMQKPARAENIIAWLERG